MKLFLAYLLILIFCKPALAQPVATAQPGLLTLADRTQLPMRVWSAPEPKIVVLGVHGFNDYSKAFDELAQQLVAQQQAVVYAYDQRGFGANPNPGIWPGDEQLLSDIREIAQQLRRHHPKLALVVIGESMGGALVLRAATEPPGLEADKVVLKAPAIWGAEAMPWVQRLALAWFNQIAPDFTFSGRGLKTLGISPTDDPEVSKRLSQDPLVIKATRVSSLYGVTALMGKALHHPPRFGMPTLVVYGLNDKIIPPAPTCHWLSRLEGDGGKLDQRLQFIIYPQGWHMLTRQLEAKRVIEDITQWVGASDQDTPLPPLLRLDEARRIVCQR